jgi:NAD(P)-dependent dehydrogenase (short-subunit alcohol dehydrogenase family)
MPLIDLDFTGRHVAVFGGTTGINLGIALAFAQRSACVTVVSRRQENVDAALTRLRETGARAEGFSADVRDYDAVARTLERQATSSPARPACRRTAFAPSWT